MIGEASTLSLVSVPKLPCRWASLTYESAMGLNVWLAAVAGPTPDVAARTTAEATSSPTSQNLLVLLGCRRAAAPVSFRDIVLPLSIRRSVHGPDPVARLSDFLRGRE